jgi:hypothetical protein
MSCSIWPGPAAGVASATSSPDNRSLTRPAGALAGVLVLLAIALAGNLWTAQLP